MKVLVAEDDKFLLNAYKVKLTKVGYELKTATDGDEVFEVLKDFIPDVIILDLIMPKKDGFHVLQQMQDNDKFKHIPVIVASNLGQKEDIDHAMKLGAKDYIIKSDFSLSALVNKINSLVHSH